MEHSRKRELAFLYLQGTLESEDKRIVFDLILRDAEFRLCLKEEVDIRERMKHLRTAMNPALKGKLFVSIRKEAELAHTEDAGRQESQGPAWLKWSEWTLRLMLPPLVYPIIKQLQRRVFA